MDGELERIALLDLLHLFLIYVYVHVHGHIHKKVYVCIYTHTYINLTQGGLNLKSSAVAHEAHIFKADLEC